MEATNKDEEIKDFLTNTYSTDGARDKMRPILKAYEEYKRKAIGHFEIGKDFYANFVRLHYPGPDEKHVASVINKYEAFIFKKYEHQHAIAADYTPQMNVVHNAALEPKDEEGLVGGERALWLIPRVFAAIRNAFGWHGPAIQPVEEKTETSELEQPAKEQKLYKYKVWIHTKAGVIKGEINATGADEAKQGALVQHIKDTRVRVEMVG